MPAVREEAKQNHFSYQVENRSRFDYHKYKVRWYNPLDHSETTHSNHDYFDDA